MKTFKEYREEVAKQKLKLPVLETMFGNHSKVKSEQSKPSMETVFGKHSQKKIDEGFDSEPKEIGKLDQEHIHLKVAHPQKITSEQKESLSEYSDCSRSINGALHRQHLGHTAPRNPVHEHIKNLTDTLNNHKTGEDMSVYTGLPNSPAKHFKDHTKPQHVHLPAFTSTSTSLQQAKGFAEQSKDAHDHKHGLENKLHRHVLKIDVPKGSSAMSLRKHSFVPKENEILLNRGHEIEIHPKPTVVEHMLHGTHVIWHAKLVAHKPGEIKHD